MSELDDIMAAAGIVVVDSAPGDGGDAKSKDSGRIMATVMCGGSGDISEMSPQVAALEAMFGDRYTMEDKGYAEFVGDIEFNSTPPCVPNFREKRGRDFNGRGRGGRGDWGRGRGGGRGGGGWRQHGDGHGHHNRYDSYNNRQSYRDREDHYNRNRHNQHRDGGDDRRGYNQHQDRYRDRERNNY